MAVGNLLFAYDPTNDTPETVQKKRAMIAQLMASSQRPRNVGEGVGAMMTGLAAGIMNHRATKAERTGRENATKTIADLLSGIGGSDGPSGGMVAPQSSQQSAPQAFAPSAPGERQPLDMPSQRVAQAHGDAPASPMSPFRDAIASIESAGSGDYAAVGPTHSKLGRALGRYQIMEANIGPWSREALGREVTPAEFMANPQIQDAIFDHKFGTYVDQFGPEGAAQAWFAGPGGVGKTNRKDVLGTDVGSYGQKFMSALGPQGNDAVQAVTQTMQGGNAPVQMAQAQPQTMNDAGGPSMQQLLEAAQNPWLSDSQRSIVNTLLEQRMQAQDPMRQMQMEKARLELDQMRNPQQSLINAGDGRIYDPNSQQWITAPNAGQGFRKATPEEAAQYGAAGGQFGPDGRFYPINPPSGTALSVDPTTGAVSFQQGSGVKPLTEGQSKDAVYATRAEGSLGTLDQFGDALTNPLGHAAEKDPTGLIRRQQSPEFQQAQQAGREFLQAILRKDTGAAITTDEMDSYGRTYLPMPGDGPELLRQKQIARKRALEALKAGMPPQAILQQEKALANVDASTAQGPQQDEEGWREIAPGVRVKRVD